MAGLVAGLTSVEVKCDALAPLSIENLQSNIMLYKETRVFSKPSSIS